MHITRSLILVFCSLLIIFLINLIRQDTFGQKCKRFYPNAKEQQLEHCVYDLSTGKNSWELPENY
jgi:hypothetical protein